MKKIPKAKASKVAKALKAVGATSDSSVICMFAPGVNRRLKAGAAQC
jgi:hypothetical protein